MLECERCGKIFEPKQVPKQLKDGELIICKVVNNEKVCRLNMLVLCEECEKDLREFFYEPKRNTYSLTIDTTRGDFDKVVEELKIRFRKGDEK